MLLSIPPSDESIECKLDNLKDVPKLPGCYAIWNNETLVYTGISGMKWTKENPKTSHLKHRLRDHISGTKSDVFPTYVFERFLIGNLSSDEIDAIKSGEKGIRHFARSYIQDNLSFTYATTTNFQDAVETEEYVRKGGLGMKPIINPLNGSPSHSK